MEFMLYPTFKFGNGRIIPDIRLPRNFKEIIPKFYEQERKETVESYIKELDEHLNYCGIDINLHPKENLKWDNEKGLVSIAIGPSAGLDLNERGWPSFKEHNMGRDASFVAGAIAMKYVSELLKSSSK